MKSVSAPTGKFTTGDLTWKGRAQSALRSLSARWMPEIAPSFSFSSATGTGSGTMDLVSGSDSPIAVGIEGLAPMFETAVTKTPGAFAPGMTSTTPWSR